VKGLQGGSICYITYNHFHCHMYIKMTHCGLQLILCCVVMTDDERAMCFLNAVINALQLSGSEFCSVGGFYTLTLVDKTDHQRKLV